MATALTEMQYRKWIVRVIVPEGRGKMIVLEEQTAPFHRTDENNNLIFEDHHGNLIYEYHSYNWLGVYPASDGEE